MRSTRFVALAAALLIAPHAALSQADSSLKLSTTSSVAASEFRAGLSDFQNISFESAAAHFKAAVDADPGFGLGRVLYASLAPLDVQQQAIEANRGVADAARGSVNELVIAAAYREAALGHRDATTALFRAAAQMMPGDQLLAWNAAGGFGAPLATLQEFVAKYPNYGLGYNMLAYQEYNAGNRSRAIAAAKRQIELEPNAPNPHDTYAEILQFYGNFPEATAHYRQAASLTPKFPAAYVGLAEVAALQGQYDQARSYLNQAIANAWTPRQKLGYMRQIVGTYALQGAPAAQITSAIEAAVAEANAQGDARTTALLYSQLATVQANAGNVNAAHQSIAKATGGTDVPSSARYYSAMAHGLMKHWAPAGQLLGELKAQAAANPGSVGAPTLAALEGYQLTQQGKPADALPILMAADTTDVLVMNRIAEAHAALGHAAEAAAWNNRINKTYAIALGDFGGANSRRRARPKR